MCNIMSLANAALEGVCGFVVHLVSEKTDRPHVFDIPSLSPMVATYMRLRGR